MQIYHETFLEFENKDVWKPMSDLQLIIKYENDNADFNYDKTKVSPVDEVFEKLK